MSSSVSTGGFRLLLGVYYRNDRKQHRCDRKHDKCRKLKVAGSAVDILARCVLNVVAGRVHIPRGVYVVSIAPAGAEDVCCDRKHCSDNTEHGALAEDASHACNDAEDAGDYHCNVKSESHVQLVLNACNVVVDALTEGGADHEAFVEIGVRCAVEHDDGLTVFVQLVPAVIGAEHLLRAVNDDLVGAEAVDGKVFEAHHGVLIDHDHVALKGVDLGFAGSKSSFAFLECRSAACEVLLALLKSRKTVLILL